MFEGAVAGILNRILGKYVQDLDTENLNVGIFSGNVNLTDLKLKPEALYELDLPIDVKIGTIGRINLQIPWSGLYTQPVIVYVDDVLILVGPAISNTHFDPDREKRLTRAAKRKILQDLEDGSEILKGPQNFLESLFTAIVNNIQIYVRNIHIRYEDSISSKEGPLAGGLCLQSLSIETTNSKWKPSVTPCNASTVYQMMRIESLSLYWNSLATVLDDTETANITPIQYYNWKHYMLTGLDKFSMHREDFEFLLKPVTCKVKVLINRSGEARVPRLLLDAVLQDSALQLSRRQYLSLVNISSSFERIRLNRKYRHLHPGVPLLTDVKKWWHYSYKVVLEQRVRPYTWTAIKRHRENYNLYKQTYKSTLKSPNDTELKLDLQKCEDSLPIVSVVIAREQAKFELLSEDPDRIEVQEKEHKWWQFDESDAMDSRAELCVKSGRSKGLWCHLSSPERKKVCEIIGYAEGAARSDKSKQYIEHKINLTLANCSVTLMDQNKEILLATVTQFLASLETRPSAKAYKLSARAESLLIEGISPEGESTPLLAGSPLSPGAHLIALDAERRPLNSHADYGLSCLVEPVTVTYVEHAFTELLNFFQTKSMTKEDFVTELHQAVDSAKGMSKALAAYAVSRKKLFQIHIDVKGLCIVLPENGTITKNGRILALDMSRLTVRSELQPPDLPLEDATCMELEERLYDRLHADCTLQVLFTRWSPTWAALRQPPDSSLHLVPRLKVQLVFSSCIRHDYALLPRYKLNISLSSLKLNLSDRIIAELLSFTVPVPEPDGVGTPESVGTATADDRVEADPEYADLIELRHNIVAAYLAKNRVPDAFDKANAKLGFQTNDQVFVSSEHSDSDMEVYARSVDLPGFDDNVSPSNTIRTLLRFLVGDIVINIARTQDLKERPYVMLNITKVCLDVAVMRYGPAIQLAVGSVLLTDKRHHCSDGLYLEMVTSDGELVNLLYRKVRADCPEFKTHFHAVEQSLVVDTGPIALLVQSTALSELSSYLLKLWRSIQSQYPLAMSSAVYRARSLWRRLMAPENDPPVPSGATKFSYSFRSSSLSVKLSHIDAPLMEVRLGPLDSDCVYRANDRMIFRCYLSSLHVDDLAQPTLYPKLVWPDEDKLVEVKYVRTAPRLYGSDVTAHGELRASLGRVHVVLMRPHLMRILLFLEPLIPPDAVTQASAATSRALNAATQGLRHWNTRLNLVIQIHAPVLLLAQKTSSPHLLVLNLGDLQIENLFKHVNSQAASSPMLNPIIDNILVKLDNVTLARAVMTLAGSLEVQEPMLEPVCLSCDISRAVGYAAAASAHRALLLAQADVTVNAVTVTLGPRDLAVLRDTYAHYWTQCDASLIPSPPEPSDKSSDAAVRNLQAFLAQGEPVRKEVVLRLTVEGVEIKLFTDSDEVLSSPVRDLSHGLAKVTAGEGSALLEWSSDGSAELRASLLSLMVEDIRPDPTILIKRIFQSQGGATRSTPGISVSRPPLIDVTARATDAGRSCDVRVDRTRLNLSMPFMLQLARTLLDVIPVENNLEGGVVNHGYVGEPPVPGNNNRPSENQDKASGVQAGGCSEAGALTISVHFRQPELMIWAGSGSGSGSGSGDAHGHGQGHALLARADFMLDYSSRGHCLLLSLASLQVMSKLQSQLKNLPPELVLKPCDIEFSKTLKSAEEGVKSKLTVSEIELHIAGTTVHTIMDIIEEINLELSLPEEEKSSKSPNAIYMSKPEKFEEDLWSPKKIAPYVYMNMDDNSSSPKYPTSKHSEIFTMNVPNIKIQFELEQTDRIPVLVAKLTLDVSLHDWSNCLHGDARATLSVSCYNEQLRAWEPLVEPTPVDDTKYRPWEITATLFQGKAHPLSSRLDTTQQTEPQPEAKPSRKRHDMESETSADECDTDCEMTFIRNPHGSQSRASLSGVAALMDGGAGAGMGMGCQWESEGGGESDSEGGDQLMDKLAKAISHLVTDDSSGDELNEVSSASEQSDAEGESETEDRAVTFSDSDAKKKRDGQRKSVTLQDPFRTDSVDSGLDTEYVTERNCTYILLESRDTVNVTVTPSTARVLTSLANACADRTAVVTAIVTGDSPLVLVNDIGPGSTVHLKTKAETDLAGHDRILAVADYDADCSRPSTPGDIADLDGVASERDECMDVSDDWDCFEGGFPSGAVAAPDSSPLEVSALYRRHTDHTLTLRLHDMDQLTVLCPQRSLCKLHVLHPSKNNTRYYVAVERLNGYNTTRVVVRSPLQIRNETSYALELLYKKSELVAAGAEPMGVIANPFDDRLKLAVLAPHDTYNVPLYIAYHCRLYLQPANFESSQSADQGVWWLDLVPGQPRELVCRAKPPHEGLFAITVLAVPGVQSPKVTRAIPNYMIRVLPPLALYNRLPYALEVATHADNKSGSWRTRVEAGDRAHTHCLELSGPVRMTLHVTYLGLPWTGSFTLSPDTTEKIISMWTDCDTDGGNKQLGAAVKVERDEGVRLLVHAPYWIINATTLPLQLKARHSDTVYEVTPEPLLWAPRGRDHKIRLRAHQSAWSRAARPAACAPGLIVCGHTERNIRYRLLMTTTLSELSPQLTKLVTLLPYFIVYNDTKRHLRFMEENEAADLWMDLNRQQCTPFWPQTDSMRMHVKFRDSTVVSQHFQITVNHFTVLRMDKGSALCVEVSGGTDRPFAITFRPYAAGAAPVRVDNLCDRLYFKLHQRGTGQVALVSPYQSMLYTWDDPTKERVLLWNVYNNKDTGYPAQFMQDGFGEQKVTFTSVKHPTLTSTNSILSSKLSSTFKRLTPMSTEACYSSSDSDEAPVDSSGKDKKLRKDKVIIYWISYMDGYQRVIALIQDEKLAYEYKSRIDSERSNFEVYLSLSEATMSVCVDSTTSVKELALISMTDSLPRWEVNVSRKWKQLSPDLTAWIEEKYQTDQKKCNLKEYIHIDLEKMQMTKPFFAEIRRTYNPALWLQLRKSNSLTYLHLKVNRFQIDNQLHETVFPTVLYPAPLPNNLLSREFKTKPCLEIVVLKQQRPSLNQDIYKYIKVLVQEYCVNLDRGFVSYVFDILNRWKVEDKPAVRLRADLALVHTPLHMLAAKQTAKRNVLMEFVHLSPIKLVLSLSSRGYSAESVTSPTKGFGNKKDNRPKLFNSDLLEYLFNSWGSSLCDMKDVIIRMSYLELRNAHLSVPSLMERASQHYWPQLVQQFYVLVLGLSVLGNPYSDAQGFCKGLRCYYEPYLGCSRPRSDPSVRLAAHCAAALGLRRGGAGGGIGGGWGGIGGGWGGKGGAALSKLQQRGSGDGIARSRSGRTSDGAVTTNGIPEWVIEGDRNNPANVALALTGLLASPSFEDDYVLINNIYRSVACRLLPRELCGAERALRALAERSGGRVVHRRRLPRHCPVAEALAPYSAHLALGAHSLRQLRLRPGPRAHYAAHAPLLRHTQLILTTTHIVVARSGAHNAWRVEWSTLLDDLIGVPAILDDCIVLQIKQDELTNYFATDEKCVAIPDEATRQWLQAKIEAALILGLEDKRVPEH